MSEHDAGVVATALASSGKPGPFGRPHRLVMPGVSPAADCRPLIENPVVETRAGLLVEHRPAAPPLPLTGGDRAEILVWMRLLEDRPIDARSDAVLPDAGPPALYGVLSEYVAMPSTEITLHFADLAAAAAGPWVLGVFRTSYAADRYASEDGELWTEDGRLGPPSASAAPHPASPTRDARAGHPEG